MRAAMKTLVALLIFIFVPLVCSPASAEVSFSVSSTEIPMHSTVEFLFDHVKKPYELKILESFDNYTITYDYSYSSDSNYDELTFSDGKLSLLSWYGIGQEVGSKKYQFTLQSDNETYTWEPVTITWYTLGQSAMPTVALLQEPKTGEDFYIGFNVINREKYDKLTYWYSLEKQNSTGEFSSHLGGYGTSLTQARISGLYVNVPGLYTIRCQTEADGYDVSDTYELSFEVKGEPIPCPDISVVSPIYVQDGIDGQFEIDDSAIIQVRMWGIGVDEDHNLSIKNQRLYGYDNFYYEGDYDLQFACQVLNSEGNAKWTEWRTIKVEARPLTTESLPNDVTRIEDEAFYGSDLVGITIPASCEYIGSKAFAMCSNLRKVVILAEDTEIATDAFSGSTLVKLYVSKDNTPNYISFAEQNNIPMYYLKDQ